MGITCWGNLLSVNPRVHPDCSESFVLENGMAVVRIILNIINCILLWILLSLRRLPQLKDVGFKIVYTFLSRFVCGDYPRAFVEDELLSLAFLNALILNNFAKLVLSYFEGFLPFWRGYSFLCFCSEMHNIRKKSLVYAVL